MDDHSDRLKIEAEAFTSERSYIHDMLAINFGLQAIYLITLAIFYASGRSTEAIGLFVISQFIIIPLALSNRHGPDEELSNLSKHQDHLTRWLYQGTLPSRLYIKALRSLDKAIHPRTHLH